MSEKTYEIGQAVKYRSGDSKWRKGVIHGVTKHEDPATNEVVKVLYLVDTLEDERVDEITQDKRDNEINKRARRLISKGMDPVEAVAKISENDDLPKRQIFTEKVRQPKQTLVSAKDIKQNK